MIPDAEKSGQQVVKCQAFLNESGIESCFFVIFWSLEGRKEPCLMTGYMNLQLGLCSSDC